MATGTIPVLGAYTGTETIYSNRWLTSDCMLKFFFYFCGLLSCDSFLPFVWEKGKGEKLWSLDCWEVCFLLAKYRSYKHYLLSIDSFITVFHLLYFPVNFDFKNSSLDFDVANSWFLPTSNSEILLVSSVWGTKWRTLWRNYGRSLETLGSQCTLSG